MSKTDAWATFSPPATFTQETLYDEPVLTPEERQQAQMPMFVPPVFGMAIMKMGKLLPEMMRQLDAARAESQAMKLGIKHFTKTQAGELLGFSVRQIDKFVADGKLIPVDFSPESASKDYRFTYSEIKRASDQYKIEVPRSKHEEVLVRGRAVTKR